MNENLFCEILSDNRDQIRADFWKKLKAGSYIL